MIRRNPLLRAASAACLAAAMMSTACDDDDAERDDDGGQTPQPDGDAGAKDGEAAAVDASTAEDSGARGDGSVCFGEACNDPSAFRPEPVPPTDALISQLKVPDGFSLSVFASGLAHARMLLARADSVYLTRPKQGDVLRLVDANADGVAEAQEPVATGMMGVHGIAFHEDTVYLATPTEVYRATVDAEGAFSTPVAILTDLPDGGQHPNRTLGIGPDNLLYVSVGSSCDACQESNPEHATMLRAALDGSTRSVFARGLRNTLGFAWHPMTQALWGMDQGSDWRGNDLPPEELNLIESGKDYGWPYCYGAQHLDPIIEDPPMGTKEAYCAASTPPVLVNQAHGSPIAFAFYQGESFPSAYRGGAFLALRGSWNRSVPTGYKIVHVRFQNDEPVGFDDFVTGFLIEDGRKHFGRVAGITVAADGALLFSDDENGYVYRVQAQPEP